MGAAKQFAEHLAAQYGVDDVVAASAAAPPVGIAAVRCTWPHLFVLAPLPAQDAFMISVELSDAGSRRYFGAADTSQVAPLPAGSMAITDLRDPHAAFVCSPFHSVLFHLDRAVVERFAADAGIGPVQRLACLPNRVDPVIAGLARAVLPALEAGQPASSLFLDHVVCALLAHLLRDHGAPAPRVKPVPPGLAPWQERRAKELLLERLGCGVSVDEVAAACGLSRSHFGKAFKQTTGRTPHAWLTERRIETAQQMLCSTLPLSQIADACGFADQSHLTRVFGARTGRSPAQWRRLRPI